jgi:hypothetical protein
MAIQTATNPQTGERVALVGGVWQPIVQTATNKAGAKAYLVGSEWLVDDTVAPKPAPAAPKPAQVESDVDYDFGDAMGTGSSEIMAQPNRERKTYTGSVFDTQPFDPKFDSTEATRLSRREYAEKEKTPPSRTQYAKATPKEQLERTVGQTALDTTISALQGMVGVPKTIASNINAGDNPIARFYEEATQAGERSKSPYLRSQQAEREAFLKNVLENQGELAQTRAAFTSMFSPAGADIVTQGAGSIVPTLGMSLFGLGQRSMMAVNALSVAGEAAQNTAQKLSQMSPENWSNSSAYQDLRDAGMSHKDAVNMLAPLFAMPSQFLGLVIGGASGATGLEKTLAGKSIKGGARERAARAGAEVLGEEAETLVPSFVGNVTQRIFDDKQSLTEGLGKEAVETAFGTIPGAAIAASGRSNKAKTSGKYSAEDLARSKGFLVKPPANQETEIVNAPPPPATTPPPAPPAPPAPPSTTAQAGQIRADRVTQTTQLLVQQGIPAENAGRIAERRVDAELKAEAKSAAIKVPEGRVEQLTQDLIASGVPPQQALLEAQKQAQEEAQADELARTEAEESGAASTAESIGTPSGASVSVAGQPSTVPPAAGVGDVDTSGVVPTGQTTTAATSGETAQPAPLSGQEAVQKLNNDIEAMRSSIASIGENKPAAVEETPAKTSIPLYDRLGLPQGPARADAKNDEISVDDAVLLKKMVVKTVEDGLTTGKNRQQIVDQIVSLTKDGIKPGDFVHINEYLTERGVKEAPIETPTKIKPQPAPLNTATQDTPFVMRSANKQEQRITSNAVVTLPLPGGAKAIFTQNGDGDIELIAPNGKPDKVVRAHDTREGAVRSLKDFPNYVPEPLRQLMLDYQQAAREQYYAEGDSKETAQQRLSEIQNKITDTVTSLETKGADVGTETTETQQTAQEGQAAPTAGAVTPSDSPIEVLEGGWLLGKPTKIGLFREGDLGLVAYRLDDSGNRIGEPVGNLNLEKYSHKDNIYSAEEVNVFELLRGQGLPEAMYTAMANLGFKIKQSPDQSTQGEKMWERFKSNGLLREDGTFAGDTKTQQAAQEGQTTPAAGAVTKGKRGRPPAQQRHVVTENPEGGFDHVTDGEVTATYKNRKQAVAAINLAKAKDRGDTARVTQYQAELDKALASQGRGRPAKAAAEEGTVELNKEEREELDRLNSALETYNSPVGKDSVANAAMYINEIANDPTVPKAVRERAKQMLEEDVDPKDIPKKLRSTENNVGKADTGFNNVTNGAQAIVQIIKTGNAFQRFVAQRIRNFLSGVKFVVLEVGDTIPTKMENARGLFVYDAKSKTRTVYVRGASFGNNQGINNITVLHELLHAATAQRIGLSLIKGIQNLQLKIFKNQMEALAKRVKEAYDLDLALGDISPEMEALVNGTLVVDEKTNKASYEIFSSPDEFLAYGMSSPVFQKFLMGVKGKQTGITGFSTFVTNIRELFGIKENEATAFSDLVNITDKMLSTRMEPVKTTSARNIALPQKGEFTPPEFDEQADIRAKRSALELERDARKAKQNVANSREGDISSAVAAMQGERSPSKVRQILANAWSVMDYAQREAMVRLPTFDFLAKWAEEKGISSLRQTNTYLERMLGMSQQFLAGAEQVVGMLDRGFKEDKKLSRKAFEDFVYATTIAEIDPSDPNAVERSKTLDADYKALGPVGQRMYKDLRNYYEGIIELYSDLLDDQIQNAQGLTQGDKNKIMAMLRKTFEAKARIKPYFPLVRRGDFWLAIGSGADRRFYTFESRIDRNNKAAELAAGRGDDIEDLLFRQEFVQGNDLGSLRTASKDSSQMLKQTFDAIDKMEMGEDSAGAKEGLKDAVYQIYLSTMPEQTFRKQFTHRKNRMGFSTDVRQNVATTAAKQATQLARLKYAPLLRNSVSAAKDAIREREELSPFVQEAEKRVNLALSGGGNTLGEAIAGTANKASFFWYLSSASSALIQPSSIFISGLPVLAGNYNNASGAGLELAKMVTLVNQYSILRTNSDGSTSISAPSIANNKSLPADERQAVSEMVSRGVSQSTYASMVWGYKQTPTESMYFSLDKGFGNIPVAYGKGKRMASFLVGALMHNTERLSREAVYLAAYRLGKKQGLTYTDAVQKAVDSTNEALGNYDITNKPRFMQQGIGKVAFQFKMYPLQMTLLMLTNFRKMLPFLNKEGKKEAATKFFGMMGTSALLGGVANMALFSPIMGLIGWAWSKMRDDKDWPEELKDIDFETWFRQVFLPEKLGDVTVGGVPVSDLIDRGPLNALTGYDIASRIGLNDLWGRASKEVKTSRDSAIAFMLDNFGGPTSSLLLGFADAYDAYALGDYQKMQEKLAPSAIRNLLIANRMADEGMKTGRGVELVGKNDVKTGELIGQAVGFRPDILAATQGPAFKLIGIEQKINNQRNLILNKLDFQLRKDTDEGDKKYNEILENEVEKFNKKYPSYALDDDAIDASITKKAEQRATSRAGVVMNEKNIPIYEEGVNTLEARLDRRVAEMKARREKNPR